MKYIKLIIVLVTALTSFACQKYLDIKTQSQQVFIKTSRDCQGILDNYSILNIGYPSDGEASAGDYFMSDASYLSGARTQEDRNIYTWQSTAIRSLSNTQWKPSYFKIYTANLVLEALPDLVDNPPQATVDNLRGSALFFRAFAFWQIAQLYARPFQAATSDLEPGIPLRLKSDINEISDRGTVSTTYNRIIDDLKESISLLPISSQISSRPNKVAAYAMLARVYLSMADYPNALIYADLALKLKSDLINYNSVDKLSITPFSRFNTEVIFQAVMTSSQLLVGGTSASNVAKIEPQLVASYAINDLRRTIFFKNVAGSVDTYTFTGNYEPTTNGTNFVGLAVDELYLIRSECFARAGNISAAMTDLNTLLKARFLPPYLDIIATDATDALNKILVERRKELVMRGLRWSDLRRLNFETSRSITLKRIVQGVEYTLPPNDARYTLLIPNEVIINSSMTQNQR